MQLRMQAQKNENKMIVSRIKNRKQKEIMHKIVRLYKKRKERKSYISSTKCSKCTL